MDIGQLGGAFTGKSKTRSGDADKQGSANPMAFGDYDEAAPATQEPGQASVMSAAQQAVQAQGKQGGNIVGQATEKIKKATDKLTGQEEK